MRNSSIHRRKKERTANPRYKKLPDQLLFNGCSLIQLLCIWLGHRPQSATFHTAKRWVQCKENE